MIAPHILVVGSEPTTLHTISAMLSGSSYRAEESAIGAEVLARVHGEPAPDLVLLDLGNGNGIGLQTLQQLRAIQPDLAIVVLSVSGDTKQVVDALRLGARDYLNAPLQPVELQQVLLRCLGPKMSTAATTDPTGSVEELGEGVFFVAASPAMRKVRIQAELLANIDAPVLLLGESGTGKEVIAHLLHELSSRSRSRFLKVNCAAVPGELLESELFGYERGAFTGATRTKQGKFELCNKGTILLDEVAEMSANLQAKLLHVIQDRQFFRLGGETTIDVDVRILAATNVNVPQAIAERKFRQDLYYRLNAFTICLPPLRERQEEIPLLLQHFMGRTATQYARPPIRFSPRLIEACLRYPWPGNLRELENFVKRYLVIRDEAMAIAELRANWRPNQSVKELLAPTASCLEVVPAGHVAQGPEVRSVLRALKDETEIQAIAEALKETVWNRKRAARLLNISYRGLLYKIRKHGIIRNLSAMIAIIFAAAILPLWSQSPPAPSPIDSGTSQLLTNWAARPPADPNDYEISPDDLLSIDVFEVNELSGEYRVSPNGLIRLRLLSGPIAAAGLTPSELADRISERLRTSRYVGHPAVNVQVKESRVHSVAITGAVKRPQIYPVLGQTTLLDLISQAEGLTDDAGSAAIITRGAVAQRRLGMKGQGGENQHPMDTTSVTVDLKRLLETGDSQSNPIVYPGDRVTVPHAGVFYVLGAVTRPGGYNLRDAQEPITVLMAIATAGGLTPTAKNQKCVLIRKNSQAPDGKEQIPINLKDVMSERAPDQKMNKDDVLLVPESGGKKAGRAVLSSVGAITTTAASGVIVYRR